MVKTIRVDSFFGKKQKENINIFFKSIQVYVDMTNVMQNYYKEALSYIICKWGLGLATYIQNQGYVERNLWLITVVTRRHNINDFITDLFLTNI